MDPLTFIATAVALGASEGIRNTAKVLITDSYAALRRYLSSTYAAVAPEVESLEAEPDEQLRRALLAKKLDQAGAADDHTLRTLAEEVVRHVADHAPDAATTVGVQINRVEAGGDISISDITTRGASGVIASDVFTHGSFTISGVHTADAAEPTGDQEAPTSDDAQPGHTTAGLSSTQSHVHVGGNNITQFTNYEGSAGNSGRVRAVTISVEKVPFGDGLWLVKVNNGSGGPITELEVTTYLVDDSGLRIDGTCLPAKGRINLSNLVEMALTEGLAGGLGAIGTHAQGMRGIAGMYPGGMPDLRPYAGMMASQFSSSPQSAAFTAQLQAGMTDAFPRVLAAGDSAQVIYVPPDSGQPQADIAFEDESGQRWLREFGRPVRKDE